MNKLDRNQNSFNERRSAEIDSHCNKSIGRRRHLTTINRVADSVIPEEENSNFIKQSPNGQQASDQSNVNQTNSGHCCCCHSEIVICSVSHRLPDLIIQHQPATSMSSGVHFEQTQQIPVDSLSSKIALVYTSHWIENDVFLPGNQSYSFTNTTNNIGNNQGNNQAINQVNKLLNNQANKQKQQPDKIDLYSPRIIGCQLANSVLYNQRMKAKIIINNARRSASVSLPIDHETLRQVGYSLRMISEQFHLQRLQANALMAKNEQTSNVSYMIRWFCKLVVNKLPSFSWKSTENKDNKVFSPKSSPVKPKASHITNQYNGNKFRSQLNSQSDQPDVVPYLLIPVRQRCRSTTTDC